MTSQRKNRGQIEAKNKHTGKRNHARERMIERDLANTRDRETFNQQQVDEKIQEAVESAKTDVDAVHEATISALKLEVKLKEAEVASLQELEVAKVKAALGNLRLRGCCKTGTRFRVGYEFFRTETVTTMVLPENSDDCVRDRKRTACITNPVTGELESIVLKPLDEWRDEYMFVKPLDKPSTRVIVKGVECDSIGTGAPEARPSRVNPICDTIDASIASSTPPPLEVRIGNEAVDGKTRYYFYRKKAVPFWSKNLLAFSLLLCSMILIASTELSGIITSGSLTVVLNSLNNTISMLDTKWINLIKSLIVLAASLGPQTYLVLVVSLSAPLLLLYIKVLMQVINESINASYQIVDAIELDYSNDAQARLIRSCITRQDERPDTNSMQDIKHHNAAIVTARHIVTRSLVFILPATFLSPTLRYEVPLFWLTKTKILFGGVSLEHLSQIATARNLRLNADSAITFQRIEMVSQKLNTINMSRYLPLTKRHVIQNTQLAAYFMFKDMERETGSFPFPIPVNQK